MELNLNLKDHVDNNQMACFKFYRSGNLFYETEKGLQFRVPIEDTSNGTFLEKDKAVYFMRWIRKEIESIKQGLEDSI